MTEREAETAAVVAASVDFINDKPSSGTQPPSAADAHRTLAELQRSLKEWNASVNSSFTQVSNAFGEVDRKQVDAQARINMLSGQVADLSRQLVELALAFARSNALQYDAQDQAATKTRKNDRKKNQKRTEESKEDTVK
jgi:hypothetical protein